MNPVEARKAYERLIGALRQLDLTWIVEEIEQQVAAGKTKRVSLRVPKGTDVDFLLAEPQEPSWRRGPTQFLRSEAYTEVERLLLLVDAIQHVVEAGADMEAEIIHQTGAVAVVFESEAETESVRRLESNEGAARSSFAVTLRELLMKLRAEALHGE